MHARHPRTEDVRPAELPRGRQDQRGPEDMDAEERPGELDAGRGRGDAQDVARADPPASPAAVVDESQQQERGEQPEERAGDIHPRGLAPEQVEAVQRQQHRGKSPGRAAEGAPAEQEGEPDRRRANDRARQAQRPFGKSGELDPGEHRQIPAHRMRLVMVVHPQRIAPVEPRRRHRMVGRQGDAGHVDLGMADRAEIEPVKPEHERKQDRAGRDRRPVP